MNPFPISLLFDSKPAAKSFRWIACWWITLAIGLPVGAQTVSYDFNTPGYIGSTLLLWNNSGASASAYSESTNGGTGNPTTGAVAVAPASASYLDTTLTDQSVFDFASASAGSYYTERIDFNLGSAANGGQPQKVAQLGFINANNTGFLGTGQANPAQTAPSFVSLRLCSADTNTPSSYYVETQIKLSTDSGATSANGSSSFTLSPGTWYRFSVLITNNAAGLFTLSGLVDNIGTNGLQAPVNVFTFASAVVTNAELASDSTVYCGFRSTTGTGLSWLDNFKAAAFVWSGPVATAPTFSPTNSPIYAGTPVTVLESASGIAPLHYQWQASYNNGGFTNVPNSDTNSIVVNASTNFTAGSYAYQVVVTNSLGSVTSAPSATLTVLAAAAPFVTSSTSPSSITAYLGGSANFQASFGGTLPLACQWRSSTNHSNYRDIQNATNTSLFLANLQLTNSGYYSLWASNVVSGGYTVSSGDAQLTVTNPPPPMMITNGAGSSVTVLSDGTYTISFNSPAWTFGGNLPQPPNNLAADSGADNIGAYSEITFGYTANVGHAASIRLYQNKPIVLFDDTALATTANDLAFPHLTNYPPNLNHISFGGTFGIYSFSALNNDSPWLFFDTNFNSFMLSAATNYMIAYDVLNGDGSIGCGIDPAIPQLPANFTHRTILVAQPGINRTFEAWGAALLALSGKTPPANDAAVELNKLGYWTDNGATYYYNYDGSKGYAGTLLAMRDEYASKGVPIAYLQLDSWWYPKGAVATWNNGGGIYLYQPDSTLFPDGLAAFQQQLGLPLITHARWIDTASPYQTNYTMSGGVCIDPAYWTNRMTFIKNSGVVTYEQDWLSYMGVPLQNLTDPPAYMNNMEAATATNGLNLQYCMAWPRHYLQGSLYNNLLTIRTSADRLEISKWDQFLYDSRLASALVEWPWCDVFMSAETRNLLISTLSAGPVGPGDAEGAVNAANLKKVIRTDSVIVKPDVPVVPIDQTYVDDVLGLNQPMVAAANTDHGGMRALYVYAYARSSGNRSASFTPAQLGVSGNAFVYNYFTGTGTIVSNGNAFNFTADLPDNTNGGSYFIAVPVGPSGIGLLGDTNKFVTLGKKRISDLTDSGFLRATVVYAAGETNVTLVGYAPSSPYATALSGSVGSVTYDSVNHFFAVPVSPGNAGTAMVAFSLTPIPSLQIANLTGQVRISWPTNAQGFTLQKATTLAPQPDWTPVTNAIVPTGDRNVVTLSATGSAAFYRLKQ